ncbi:hypothetical protein R5W24_000724 [Gemmata sp. JC717]|uniref:hypothetical protein n=1 Tax=Gemmata algarum TaxID=2975278 RepID=UPI0021BA50CE|nr:hypothetical protein [Gemmata algarum]MDY3551646.1 hypothetical protein [Gemmata algarum]
MRTFHQLASEAEAKFPVTMELWTSYSLTRYPEPKQSWEQWVGYHFDRGTSAQNWWSLFTAVQRWIELQPSLRRLIHFTPVPELGTDFFVQLNPPYDGGYSTAGYGEFLEYGSCEPHPHFFHQIATLHQECASALRTLDVSPRSELLRRVVHATLIRPAGGAFWADNEGWHVYKPTVNAEDVLLWAALNEG